MKTLNVIGWTSAGIGAIIILLGAISGLIGNSILPSINHVINYFHIANSFLLLAVALFIVVNRCECKK